MNSIFIVIFFFIGFFSSKTFAQQEDVSNLLQNDFDELLRIQLERGGIGAIDTTQFVNPQTLPNLQQLFTPSNELPQETLKPTVKNTPSISQENQPNTQELLDFLNTINPSQAQNQEDNFFYLTNSVSTPIVGQENAISIGTNENGNINLVTSVRWFEDNKEQLEYRNAYIYKTTSINIYETKRIDAIVKYRNSQNNKIKEQTITTFLKSSIFDVLWEADSITPIGYKGLKPLGPQQPFKVSVVLRHFDRDNNLLTEKDFSYRWTINSTKLSNKEGFGFSTITLPTSFDYIRTPITIEITATTPLSTITFNKTINIEIFKPFTIIYEQDQIEGINLSTSIGKTFFPKKNKISLIAIPYGTSKTDYLNDFLTQSWFINNSPQPQNRNKEVDLILEGKSGNINIKVVSTPKNEKKYLQQSSFNFNINI